MKEDLIDLPCAEAFLHEHLGEDVQHIQELGRGEWSVAFAYRFAGHDFVARFGFFDEDFMKDRIVAPSSSQRVPIPQIIEKELAMGKKRYPGMKSRNFSSKMERFFFARLKNRSMDQDNLCGDIQHHSRDRMLNIVLT